MSVIELIVAVAYGGVIGKDGGLPWHIPSELKRFKRLTMGKPIIMGRRTWESLPRKPLPDRKNIVITRQPGYVAEGATVVSSRREAIAAAKNAPEIAIIGGGEIYSLFLGEAHRVYLTEVHLEVAGDTRFPPLDAGEWIETARERVEGDPAQNLPSYILRTLERRLP